MYVRLVKKLVVIEFSLIRGETYPSEEEIAQALGLESVSDLQYVVVTDFSVCSDILYIQLTLEASAT